MYGGVPGNWVHLKTVEHHHFSSSKLVFIVLKVDTTYVSFSLQLYQVNPGLIRVDGGAGKA